MNDPRRSLPPVDQILADPVLAQPLADLGGKFVKARVRAVLEARRNLPEAGAGELASEVAADVAAHLPAAPTTLRPVINATGVIVHTNLGRAPLSAAARAAILQAAAATDVELDLRTGRRAPRGQGAIAALAAAVDVDGVAAHVVNNGAAALVLACWVLAPGGNVLLSRGEMVEIGDGFRIPELLAEAGVQIREVGTTNRTTLADYQRAVDSSTGFALKIHPSNFTVEGFTSGVGIGELSTHLPVPVVADIGSGLLAPHPRLPSEPSAQAALRGGADLVIASGDKLLGGPQAGLLWGAPNLIEALRRHPLARALRVDKLTLAALEATLLGPPPPVAEALTRTRAELRSRAEAITADLGTRAAAADTAAIDTAVIDTEGAVGGGGAPGVSIPSAALTLPANLAAPLRTGHPAVVGQVRGGALRIDLLAVSPDDDAALTGAIASALTAEGE